MFLKSSISANTIVLISERFSIKHHILSLANTGTSCIEACGVDFLKGKKCIQSGSELINFLSTLFQLTSHLLSFLERTRVTGFNFVDHLSETTSARIFSRFTSFTLDLMICLMLLRGSKGGRDGRLLVYSQIFVISQT